MQNKSTQILSALLGVILLAGLAQTAGAAPATAEGNSQKFDLYVSESKIVYLSKPVEEANSSNPDVISVERIRGVDNQVSLTAGAVGEATVTVRLADATRTYQIKVSPMPQRIYINIPESKYLSFKNRIDDFNTSVPGVVRVVQPTDRELLLEALPISANGTRTTLTVYSKGEIYRYYISTFDNRGADLLEIQNAFTSRGYRQLNVRFMNDEATITGSVSTQEELDDAVRIVKQYTPYVVIKAEVGNYVVQTEETDDERVIANNILRISQVKGLIVRVKFAQPQEKISSVFTRVVGKPAINTSVTDNQTRLTTNNTTLPADTSGPTSKQPIEGTLETVTTSKDNSVPEKIFLFGELEDDLAEAKAIRVARTFCPFVISMVNVKDPIQVRLKTRVLTVDLNKTRNSGINWYSASGGTTSYPSVSGGLTYNLANKPASIDSVVASLATDVRFALNLGEANNYIKEVQTIDMLLSNGQPGGIFRGESIPYVAAYSTDGNGNITTTTAFVDVGLRVTVVPLNYERGSQTPGEHLSLQNSDGSQIIPTLSKYYQVGRNIGQQPNSPLIDESIKYVDENGLIGMCVFVNVSALVQMRTISGSVTAPDTTQKSSMARAQLREGQTLVIGGILDDQLQKAIKSLPGFNKIPIFGFLFDSTTKTASTGEMVLAFTPEIVRLSGAASKRIPKPNLPEVMDLMQQQKLLPDDGQPKAMNKPASATGLEAKASASRPDMLGMPRSIETRPAESQPADSTEAKPKSVVALPTPAESEVAKPESVPLFQTPDLIPPPPAQVASQPVKDTADVPPPPAPAPAPVQTSSPAPAPAQAATTEPKIDTTAPTVNNGETNPTQIPATLP